MTSASWVLLMVAGAVALVDWWAVWNSRTRVEWAAKPSVMIALAAMLVTLDVGGAARWWMVAGALAGLVGDVALMLPRERFVAGLVAFLLGHLAYVVGLVLLGFEPGPALVGLAVVVVLVAAVGRTIVSAVAAGSPELAAPVMAYLGVISAMVVAAFGTGSVVAAVGGMLFYLSDAVLAWNRFVKPFRYGRIVTIITYHLGQAALFVALTVH